MDIYSMERALKDLESKRDKIVSRANTRIDNAWRDYSKETQKILTGVSK